MDVVYKVEDIKLERTAALIFLAPELTYRKETGGWNQCGSNICGVPDR